MNKDHDEQRKELWCGVYIAYVSAANAIQRDGAKCWADIALERFDERFPKPKEERASMSELAEIYRKIKEPTP